MRIGLICLRRVGLGFPMQAARAAAIKRRNSLYYLIVGRVSRIIAFLLVLSQFAGLANAACLPAFGSAGSSPARQHSTAISMAGCTGMGQMSEGVRPCSMACCRHDLGQAVSASSSIGSSDHHCTCSIGTCETPEPQVHAILLLPVAAILPATALPTGFSTVGPKLLTSATAPSTRGPVPRSPTGLSPPFLF